MGCDIEFGFVLLLGGGQVGLDGGVKLRTECVRGKVASFHFFNFS